MSRQKRTWLATLLLCSLLLALNVAAGWAGIAPANGIPSIDRYVIGGGGGPTGPDSHSLEATIGQPLAGIVSEPSFDLCSGFWCGMPLPYKVYLPVVVRSI
jgi:hypothetical protein